MGQPRPTLSELADDPDFKYHYVNPALGEVVTLPEAVLLWGRNKDTVIRACERCMLERRTSLTGGTTLITVASLIKLYGTPRADTLAKLRMHNHAAETIPTANAVGTETTDARSYLTARRRERVRAGLLPSGQYGGTTIVNPISATGD